MKLKLNKRRLITVAGILIVIILVIVFGVSGKGKKQNNNSKVGEEGESSEVLDIAERDEFEEEREIRIRIDEDLSTNGTVKNLPGVIWNNAHIMQNDGQMEVSITLDKESKEEKIPAKTLNIKLLDKKGKAICIKDDVQMPEIPAGRGHTTIDLTFDIENVAIVYDIAITANN